MSKNRALVTGGAGSIGHHLARRLIDEGHEVWVLDNFATGRQERLDGASGEVFNVAAGAEASILDLIDVLGEIFGTTLEPQFEPVRSGEVRHSWGDATRAARALGWMSDSSLVDALRMCISGTPEFASR